MLLGRWIWQLYIDMKNRKIVKLKTEASWLIMIGCDWVGIHGMIVHVHLLSGSFQFAVFELFPCNIVLKRILISSVMYCLIIMLAVSSRTKHLKHLDGDDLYKDLNILDIDLGFNDCEELCGESLADSQQFFEDGGIDPSFEIGSMPGSQINTKCAYAIKVCPVTCSITI